MLGIINSIYHIILFYISYYFIYYIIILCKLQILKKSEYQNFMYIVILLNLKKNLF